MKKTILTYGLISGILSAIMMAATVPFIHDLNGSKGYLVGYTTIVLSFLLVYFGIRSYRDNVGNGTITFGKAFTIGLAITLISCLFYVVTWEILYFNFIHANMSAFMDNYYGQLIQKAQSASGTPEAIQAKVAQLQHSRQLYENPFVNMLYTLIEPLPVGILITLISAAILRKKAPSQPEGSPLPATY